MATLNQSNPLILLEKEKDSNKIIFQENNLKTVLSQLKNLPICVISIAAHSSQGSSLFLGYLLKYFQVLEEGNDAEQNTLHPFTWEEGQRPSEDQVGTWIANKPFIINDSAFILLYSQCSEDEFYSEETAMNTLVGLDLHISCLTIIVSSDKLSLEFLSKVATFINIGKNQDNDATQELAFFVPNWTMVSRYPLGGEGGQKLFQKMLDACPDDVQEDISKHFNTMHTHLAPKSGEPKEFKGGLSELDATFVENLNSFGEWLMSPEAFQSQSLTENEFKNIVYTFLNKMDIISEVESSSEEEFEPEPESKQPTLLKGLDSNNDPVSTQEQPSPVEPIRLPNLLSSNTSSEDLNSPAQPSLKRPPAPPPKPPPQRSASTPDGPSSSDDLETISRKTSAPSPRRFLSQPAPKNTYSDDDDDSDSVVSSSKTSHQKFIREVIKKYHSTVKTINRKSNADYLTEAALDKAHKIATKKAIENLGELIGPEKDENAEKRLKSQLQKELITLKEKNEEERQLFLDDLTNDLVQRYKNEIKTLDEKMLQQKSKEIIKQLVMELEETLEANDDEDKWPVQQLESKLKKVEKKHLAVKEREMEESSELTEMALDFAAKDYLQAMENGLGEEVSSKIFIDLHNESREKCLEQLEEDLGAEWENGVEERLDERLIPLVDKLQEKYHIESNSNQEEKQELNSIAEIDLAGAEALNYYEQEMKKLMENGPFKERFLEEKNEQLVDEICKKYMDYLNSLNIQGNLEEYEEKLRNDLCTIYFPLRTENTQKFEHSILKTKRMSVICLKEYQSIMSQELGTVQSTEELQSLHEAAYHRAMMILQTAHLAQHDPAFVQNNMTELKNEIEGAFGEIYELYEMKQTKVSVDIAVELRKCRQFYEDEMDKHFRSNQFIKPEELERLHQRVSEKALKTMPNLTEEQKPDLKRRMEEIYMKYAELNSMNSQDQPAIGIDLGTTYCCTAIYAKGKVQVVRNGIGKNTTPSYVAFKNGKEIVGDAAKSQAYSNPENTIFDAKRIIGRKFGDPKLQEDMRLWPFSVVDEQGVPKIAVGDRYLHPEEISAKLLKQLKLDAEAYLGEKVTKAVITVPAYFTDGQRQATIDAGKMAGLNVLSILAEPTAAALAYKLQHTFESRERNVLIFDLGGGTFDVAVMRTSIGKIDILGVDGDTHLGGEDFDKSLMEHCAVEFKKQHEIDLFDGKDSDNKQKKDEVRRKLKRLQGECEKRKIELAAARIAEVNVDNMHGDIDLSVMVSRETFEDLNSHFFQKTIEIVEKALVAAKLDKSKIDDVVLVGGSTRIPKVQELLKEYFGGKTLDCSINPDEAVAYGAAMNAAMLNGSVGRDSKEYEEIQDVAPMSIGVQKYGGGFSVIIPKGSKTPVKFKQTYRTALDNQISVHITIYQGEDPVAANNEKLGDFYLSGIPPRKAGAENVDVEMTIDSQGILNVAVVSKSTGIREVSVIENKMRMGTEAIENYLQLEGHAH